MTINLNFKNLLAAVLLSSFSSFVVVSAQESNGRAPEGTAAEDFGSFRDIPYLEKAFIDTAPAIRNGAFPVGELGVDGGDKAMIVKLAAEIADGQHGNYDSMLITHKDKLLFESYYLRGRVNLAHGQASAVKSYTSFALGRAIQLGYLTMADLHKPLVSFLKEIDTAKLVEGAEKITLHKALIMHGGLGVNDATWDLLQQNPSVLKGQRFVQTLLEHSAPITTESQVYTYGNFNTDLVMMVIDAVVPGTAQGFIKSEILDKLGITNYRWQNHVSGVPESGWRASMTSRDMLKWGSVVLNDGKWNGEQLISAEYLAKATSGITRPTADWQPKHYTFGYFLYQTNITVGNKNYDAVFSWGGGGQRVIVVKDLDLTIVITGHDGPDTIMTQVAEFILPAFAK